mmetsp:Transcript_49671/g.99217  ORF Transcript_49671/g.99217 Transcript_49671/m.99217 type:complete len:82 (+) Transcript_49671:426-671(+)
MGTPTFSPWVLLASAEVLCAQPVMVPASLRRSFSEPFESVVSLTVPIRREGSKHRAEKENPTQVGDEQADDWLQIQDFGRK